MIEDAWAKPQNEFCSQFRTAFELRFGKAIWYGGQLAANMVTPVAAKHLRRDGLIKSSEKIELGDLRTTFKNLDIMVEYESGCASACNILKHWAYLRGDLSAKPQRPTLLCCFCDWWSYGAVRDVCQWTMSMMENDPLTRVKVQMFNHALRSNDVDASERCINETLDWIASETS
jgi:hypothetical protein